MGLKKIFNRIKFARVATIFLVVYAVSLTAAVVFAAFVGPLKEELNLLVKNRTLESELKTSAGANKGLKAERDTLLMAVKNLQSDLETGRATIHALRRSVNEGSVERDLARANQMVDKLSKERAALLAKLDELRKELQNIADLRVPKDNKKIAIETSDLVRGVEKEKADLQARVRELERGLKK